MQEKIFRKIEDIRRKPEHVRVWYAWSMVAVIMIFVALIWVFSLRENFRNLAPAEDEQKVQDKFPTMGTGTDRLKQSIENLNQKQPSPESNQLFQ